MTHTYCTHRLERSLLALDLKREVDQPVLLPADELALAGADVNSVDRASRAGLLRWESATPATAVNAEQPDEAKARVCVGFDPVRTAVSVQTNADLGPDPVARAAVAANARLATLGGGDYLLSRLDPLTPPDLADAVRSFANNLQDIGMCQLAGVPNTDPALAAQLNQTQAASTHIADMCK